MRLENKVAVIVGGASGMGHATALLFAQEGASVVVADLNEAGARGVAQEVRRAGGQGWSLGVDVVEESSVRAAARWVGQKVAPADILVNSLGLAEFTPMTEIDYAKWRHLVDVNLTGVFLCCREFGQAMIEGGGGKIVNFASTAGLSGVPGMVHYTAAKHGVVGLTRALAVEWGKYNVNVNCISPGTTLTPMVLGTTTEQWRAERLKRIPLQRFATPKDQAQVALFLSTADSDYLTGVIICTDGGICAMAAGTSKEALASSG